MSHSSGSVSSVAANRTQTPSSSRWHHNLLGLLRTMRPKQWSKNTFVLVGLVFDGRLLEPAMGLATVAVLIGFCLISSSVYILNDLVDIEKDRLHPYKRLRPLPSGQLHPLLAKVAMVILAVVSIVGIGMLDVRVGLVIAAYLILNVGYSFYLKNLVIIDVMMIAVFFLLRVIAGALVVHVSNFSPWLYVCVSLLALLIGFGKRRHEIILLEDSAAGHRVSLKQYNLPLLDQIIGIVTTSGLISYTLYTFEADTALAAPSRMMLTVPFVIYLVFRYLYLIHVEKRGGAPEELWFEDRPLLASICLWALSVVTVIYIW